MFFLEMDGLFVELALLLVYKVRICVVRPLYCWLYVCMYGVHSACWHALAVYTVVIGLVQLGMHIGVTSKQAYPSFV